MKTKKTAIMKLNSAMARRKTGATASELAKVTKLCIKTVRNRLAEMTNVEVNTSRRKCKQTGNKAQTYALL